MKLKNWLSQPTVRGWQFIAVFAFFVVACAASEYQYQKLQQANAFIRQNGGQL
jgi:hypothetical protein